MKKIKNIGFILTKFLKKILRNVPDKNKKYVKKQLQILDDNFLDYICYWNEKYYRDGCRWLSVSYGLF